MPNYNGSKYINYETAKVKEVGEVVEDAANEKDPMFGDEGPHEDGHDGHYGHHDGQC